MVSMADILFQREKYPTKEIKGEKRVVLMFNAKARFTAENPVQMVHGYFQRRKQQRLSEFDMLIPTERERKKTTASVLIILSENNFICR